MLDFLKATALSRSREPVFICSDMPIEELAQDMEFSKKWMLGLAAILKKGLRLDMVHDLNRPFGEMMLGLESWIPLYMTGQIMPWYLPGRQNAVYGICCSVPARWRLRANASPGILLMAATCFPNPGSDLAYYRRRAEAILKMAQPLMISTAGRRKTSMAHSLLRRRLSREAPKSPDHPSDPHAFGGMSIAIAGEKRRS